MVVVELRIRIDNNRNYDSAVENIPDPNPTLYPDVICYNKGTYIFLSKLNYIFFK